MSLEADQERKIKMGVRADHVMRIPVDVKEDHSSYKIEIGDRINVAETSATGWLVREPDGTAAYECGCGVKISGSTRDVLGLAKLHMLDLWPE